MSLDTRPTAQLTHLEVPTARPGNGSVARLVAASIAAGLAAAAVLTLLVFAGSAESTITGSILLAFALGWAFIAVLTVHRTNHPQRWAAVPAAAMGVTGIALLEYTPGYAAMTWFSWVWPPVVLPLAGWMFLQMRRSTRGVARWMLTPVIAVLALAAVGATYENIALVRDRHDFAAPGTTYDVGGHRLHLDCRGHGTPTVVLSNGMGEISASWARISGQLAGTTRVCAYDRAGQGWSEGVDHQQDGQAAATDLHRLLAAAGEAGPFVLVGHSTGGTYAMTFAARYPEQVAGMVLLDSSSPFQLTRIPAYPGQYATMRRGLALLPTLARLGISRLVPAPHLPAPAAGQVDALTSTARAARNMRDEVSVVPEVFAQAQALTTLHGRPLAVLTASESLEGAGWADAQDQLAALSTNVLHSTVHSSHAGLLTEQTPATEAVHAITRVIDSVRTGTALPPR